MPALIQRASGDGAVPEEIKTVGRADPQTAGMAFTNAPRVVVAQAVLGGIGEYSPRLHSLQPSERSSNPEIVLPVFMQAQDHFVRQTLIRPEHGEFAITKAIQGAFAGDDPDVSLMVFSEVVNAAFPETVRRGEPGPCSVTPALQACGFRAHPKSSLAVFQDALYPPVWQTAGRPGIGESTGHRITSLQAQIGADPQCSFRVFKQGADHVCHQPVPRGIARETFILQPFQTIRRGDPHAALSGGAQGKDLVRWVVRAESEAPERAFFVPDNAWGRRKPQDAILVLCQGDAIIAHEFLRVDPVEDAEGHTVETHDAKAGSKPMISVACLMDGFDRILR